MFILIFETLAKVAFEATFLSLMVYVFYRLMVDEDDPVKLKAESEFFNKEWEELCSKS